MIDVSHRDERCHAVDIVYLYVYNIYSRKLAINLQTFLDISWSLLKIYNVKGINK